MATEENEMDRSQENYNEEFNMDHSSNWVLDSIREQQSEYFIEQQSEYFIEQMDADDSEKEILRTYGPKEYTLSKFLPISSNARLILQKNLSLINLLLNYYVGSSDEAEEFIQKNEGLRILHSKEEFSEIESTFISFGRNYVERLTRINESSEQSELNQLLRWKEDYQIITCLFCAASRFGFISDMKWTAAIQSSEDYKKETLPEIQLSDLSTVNSVESDRVNFIDELVRSEAFHNLSHFNYLKSRQDPKYKIELNKRDAYRRNTDSRKEYQRKFHSSPERKAKKAEYDRKRRILNGVISS